MTEQGPQPLSKEERILRAIFGESSDDPPSKDALSYSEDLGAAVNLPADPASVSKFSHVDDDEDEDEDEEVFLSRVLSQKLDTVLTPKQASTLKLRFGLEDGQARTLAEIGRVQGVTKEAIRQREARGLKRLRESNPFMERFREYLDEPDVDTRAIIDRIL